MSDQSGVDLKQVQVFPLTTRASLSRVEEMLRDPDASPPVVSDQLAASIDRCAREVEAARQRGAGVMLIYGAHLLRNGTARIIDRLLERNYLTHLATNGAGSIHDWEYAWLGRSLESVQKGVATGTFGAWDETGRYLMLALMAGNLEKLGYGAAVGRFIAEDGLALPSAATLEAAVQKMPAHPLTPARAELLGTIDQLGLNEGRLEVPHAWKQASILACAYQRGVPMTVHPGIGYDIVSVHPLYQGSVVGRAAGTDFQRFCEAVETLDGGVVLSIGSAIMGPQVFEKSLSCVNNLRLQSGRTPVSNHTIHVVDLQDGGGWDWHEGEPPKQNPAYYLRFCKSYSRMGGAMHYHQCDNATFLHQLLHRLTPHDPPSLRTHH